MYWASRCAMRDEIYDHLGRNVKLVEVGETTVQEITLERLTTKIAKLEAQLATLQGKASSKSHSTCSTS